MGNLFHEILFRPLFNAVIAVYNFIPGDDFGLAIITFTVIMRLVMLPLTIKSLTSNKAISDLNPKIKEIREKYKNDLNQQSAEIMKLYKEKGVNPLSGCFPLLIQIPILIALYRVFVASFDPGTLQDLYSFISRPEVINNIAFGSLDLKASNIFLVIISGVGQFFQMKYSSSISSGNKEADAINKQMLYMFPIMIVIIGWNFPAGLMLYWITTTAVSFLEQYYIRSKYK